MLRRDTLVPVALIGLSVVFVLVSAAVYLSRGNPFFIRQKLKAGALILTLTAALSESQGCDSQYPPTCYEPAVLPPQETIALTGLELGDLGYVVNLAVQQVLTGSVTNRAGEAFSFRIYDGVNNLVQSDDIAAADGAFDAPGEDFEITLDPGLVAGYYELLIYPQAAADVSPDSKRYGFPLSLTEANP